MEAASSSLTTNQELESFVVVEGTMKSYSTSVGGRKSEDDELVAEVMELSSDELSSGEDDDDVSYDSEEEDSDDDDDDEEEEEIEEFFAERARIRKDAAALKQVAGWFAHPEKAVEVSDAAATARCFFDRLSVAEETVAYEGEEALERARILAEAQALKASAVVYHHPELPLEVSDAAACARNFFHRYEAEEAVSREEAEERARVLADAAALKASAVDYLHPERPVVTTDATVFGRNYFLRASAPEQETEEEDMERDDILEEMAELKRLAVDYRHPERPVVATDATLFGRNYFGRASADDQVDDEDDLEQDRILQDMAELKRLAKDYRHPEESVTTTDPAVFGRNYFGRASAPDGEDQELAEERARILHEAAALKKTAVDYMHPEQPLSVDATACARNYFGRASAPEQVDEDDDEELDLILQDIAALKKTAVQFRHPELPVDVDSTACARNYFSRYSAVEQEWSSESEERARVLAETQALKKTAVQFRHPEMPLAIDATATARSYYTRPSAPMPEGVADMEERERVLAEAKALKQQAEFYLHPEAPLAVDATATARNYFTRASAPEQESPEEAMEHARILLEAKVMKASAMVWKHPELPIQSDAGIGGRNYFNRASAPGVAENIHSIPGEDDDHHKAHDDGEEHSLHDHDYGHFDMDEDAMFADMRVSLVVPGITNSKGPKVQSSKISSDEEGELSRSPSSVMLFSGVDPESNDLRLPSMS